LSWYPFYLGRRKKKEIIVISELLEREVFKYK
jgi:hypothetical protein